MHASFKSYSEETNEDRVFVEESTSDPNEALEILMNKALKNLPVLSLEIVKEQYNRFRNSWGNLTFIQGSADDIKNIILKNAGTISERGDFKEFTVKLYLADDGYKDREAAAFEAWTEDEGWLMMVWKTENEIHAFGRPELLNI